MRPGRDPIPWVVALFVLNFALQRVSIPNLSIPITVVVVLGWMVLALALRVVELHPGRLILWLVAAAVSGLLVIPQVLLVAKPFVSVNSWALWMVVWLPLVVRLRDRSAASYQRCLQAIGRVGIGLSALSLAFVGLQLVGVTYRDWVAELLPPGMQVEGYVVSYPIYYSSEIYKSNGWLALEPSFLSFMLGVCLIAAIAAQLRRVTVLIVFLGLLSTTAGSGLAVLAVYLIAVVVTGRGALLRRYALPGAVLGLVFGTTVLGRSIVNRLSEAGSPGSSTSLRALEPYVYLWPRWVSDPAAVFVGHGAGSSAWVVGSSGILGLLVTNVAKVLFDYGMIGGLLLIVLMASTYVRSPDARIALALAVSMFSLQSASPPLVACSFLVVGLWAPARAVRERARDPQARARPALAATG